MLRSGPSLLILFILFSCATGPKLTRTPIDSVLDSIKVTGEGRGRLSLERGKYLFGYEALIKDDADWILAVSVPLHGEEIMILPQLREPVTPEGKTESFEARLEREITSRIKGSELTAKDYLQELRSLIRLVLAKQLGLKRECQKLEGALYQCRLENSFFNLKVAENKIFILKRISDNYVLELVGENLTDSIFDKTSFHLHSQRPLKTPVPILSLELFWK